MILAARARAHRRARTTRIGQMALLACCALAFLLGVWNLDLRSLWGDEAYSIWASKLGWLTLMSGIDAQPPLYHLLLSVGRALWGESEFGVRFLSLGSGVLLVAIAGRIGGWLANAEAGVLAAAVLALSPINIYFEQEARMYALAAVLAGGAMLCAVWLARPTLFHINPARSRRQTTWVWIAYGLCSVGALYSHFYTVGVLLANSAALLIIALLPDVRSRASRLAEWAVAHVGIAVLFGGWFFGLQSRYLSRSTSNRASLLPRWDEVVTNFGRGLNGLLFGMRADALLEPAAIALFLLAVLGLIGFARSRKRGRKFVGLWIAGWLFASFAIVSATAASTGLVGDFNPRYFLFALLPLILAAGGWLLAASRPLPAALTRLALTLCVLAPALYGNVALFASGWYKSRYSALVQTIRAQARPEDGIVLVNSDQFPLMDYYGPTGLPTWIVNNTELSDDAPKVQQGLAEFAQGKGRLWLVNYGWATMLQTRNTAEQALNARGVRVLSEGFQDATLALYDLGAAERAAQGSDAMQARDVGFGGQIKLIGLRQSTTQFVAGDTVVFDLIWQAERKPAADYTVFVHLRQVAADGNTGAQIAAFDSAPANGTMPTGSWQRSQIITDTRAIQIPADAAPGPYRLIIGWYLYPSFERLVLDGPSANEYALADIAIAARP